MTRKSGNSPAVFVSGLAAALLTFCLPALLVSQDKTVDDRNRFPWETEQPFSLDGKAITAALADHQEPEDHYGFETLFKDIKLDFLADGRVKREDYLVFRYLSRESANNAHISESWSPWYENRPAIKARVISRRGKIYDLDPETFVEAANDEISDRVLSDTKRIQAPLPLTNIGAVVEQQVIHEDHLSLIHI